MLSFTLSGPGLWNKDKARPFQLNSSPAPSRGWVLQCSVRAPCCSPALWFPKAGSCGQRQPHSSSTHTDPFLAEDKTLHRCAANSILTRLRRELSWPRRYFLALRVPNSCLTPSACRSVLYQSPGILSRAVQSTKGWLYVLCFSLDILGVTPKNVVPAP